MSLGSFNQVPARHTYSIGYIMLFIELVLKASISLRGTANSLEIISKTLGLPVPTPSWSCGRLWLLRLGYYKLTRNKEAGNDWAWLVDYTIQAGIQKCLVIFGIRLCHLPPKGECLKHEHLEPITLVPVTQSNGEIVYQLLEEAVSITGVPREIAGDHGPDLKWGIEKFCSKYSQISYIHDIKHKTAIVLKKELTSDSNWETFTKLAAHTKKEVQQTALAYLAPPNQRAKSRYMNLEPLLGWAQKTLIFLDKQNSEDEKLELFNKLGWLCQYRSSLDGWGQMLQVISTTESFIRKHGYTCNCFEELDTLLTFKGQKECARKVQTQLLSFVKQESLKAKPEERLIGSTEVLESVLGKQKRLEQEQVKSGFTDLILGLAAQISTTTENVVQAALQKVSTRDVLDWWKNTFGQSVQSQRKEALSTQTKRNKNGIKF